MPGVEDVHRVARLRVGVDARVVERALPQPAILVHARPGRAGVVRQEHAAVGGFDDGVDPIGVGARHRHAHLAPQRCREAGVLRQLGPGPAAIGRLEEAAARAAARQRMRRAEDFPESGVEHVGVLRVHRQIRGARLIVAEEHAVPGLAAVDRLEDSPLLIRTVRISQRGCVDDVRVGGMDANPADDHAARESHVGPCAAGVGRLVDAVSLDDVAAELHLTHSGVHDVGLRFRHGDGADRRGFEEPVRHRPPGHAAIRRFPEAASRRAEVVLLSTAAAARHGDGSAASRRSDGPPAKAGEKRGVDAGCCLRAERRRWRWHEHKSDADRGGRRDQDERMTLEHVRLSPAVTTVDSSRVVKQETKERTATSAKPAKI